MVLNSLLTDCSITIGTMGFIILEDVCISVFDVERSG